MGKSMVVLEDGSVFEGKSIGCKGIVVGPLFFDTRVVGYQEMLTDPANAGKILMPTYPLIGNYGVCSKFNQSGQAWARGLIIKEKSQMYSNWQAKDSLDNFLKRENLVAVSEVDTRTLAIHLRDKGEMWAAISTNGKTKQELLNRIKKEKNKEKESLISEVSVKEIKVIRGRKNIKVGILDLGVTKGLLSQLSILGLELVILPYNTSPEDILGLKLNGLIISSGPEADAALREVALTVKKLLGKIPILGIALGSQVIAQSLGVKLKQMKLGHHGVNYPIKRPNSYKGEITVQNHSWVVDTNSLKKIKQVKISAQHLNDFTVEEFESIRYKFIAVQYNVVTPGFNEVNSILTKFLQLMKGRN